MADIPNTIKTTAVLPIGPVFIGGQYETPGDVDWWKVTLLKDVQYEIKTFSYSPYGSIIGGIYDSKGASLVISRHDEQYSSTVVYKPKADGVYYVSFAGGPIGSYYVNAQTLDTVDDTTTTSGIVTVGGSVKSTIDAYDRFDTGNSPDVDWFKVSFVAGQTYKITLTGGIKAGDLSDPLLAGIYNADGTLITGTTNDNASAANKNSEIIFTASETASYFISAGTIDTDPSPFYNSTGLYTLSVALSDILATKDTNAKLAIDTSAVGSIEKAGDTDWFAMELQAGVTYVIDQCGRARAEALWPTPSSAAAAASASTRPTARRSPAA